MLRTLVKHRIPAQSTGHVCQGSFTKRPVLFHAFHAQTSALKRSTWLRVDKRSIDLSTGRIHKRNESGRPVKSPQYICPTDCTKARFHRALSVTARRHRNQDHSPERHCHETVASRLLTLGAVALLGAVTASAAEAGPPSADPPFAARILDAVGALQTTVNNLQSTVDNVRADKDLAWVTPSRMASRARSRRINLAA